MTKVAWFHCFNGIAGDMALGALLDAGADETAVRAILDTIPIDGWELTSERVKRNGIAATRAVVETSETHHHRTWHDISALLEKAALPTRVAARAHAVFAALAEAEARVHGTTPEEIEFHEVGSLDAIIDIVGVCAALELLDVDEIHCSPIAQGTGTTSAAHGTLPVPAPAVVELLKDMEVVGVDTTIELTTPTGAAILRALSGQTSPMPPMTIRASGFGAGTKELSDRPNLVQVIIGERAKADPTPGQPVVLLEANVDDVTGEVLAHTIEQLLQAGAHDAWLTNIHMKKGRPAHTVSALVDPANLAKVKAVITAETGTLGVRATAMERWPEAREERIVEVEGEPIRVKVSANRVKVEHDDAKRAAEKLNLPLREVLARAEAAFHQ